MASSKNFDPNKISRIIGLVFAAIGIVMLIVFIGAAVYSYKVMRSYEKTSSTIFDISYTKNNNGETHKRVSVEYEFDGTVYQEVLPNSDSSMRVGQSVAIYVDPDDPQSIETVESMVILLAVFGGFGIVFSTIGFIFFIKCKDYRKKLIDEGRGELVYATVTYAGESNVRVNYQTAYHVKATWTDESGNVHEFKSKLTYTDPRIYLNVGDQIQVYVDPKNYKHYYVCLEDLEEMFIQSKERDIQ